MDAWRRESQGPHLHQVEVGRYSMHRLSQESVKGMVSTQLGLFKSLGFDRGARGLEGSRESGGGLVLARLGERHGLDCVFGLGRMGWGENYMD